MVEPCRVAPGNIGDRALLDIAERAAAHPPQRGNQPMLAHDKPPTTAPSTLASGKAGVNGLRLAVLCAAATRQRGAEIVLQPMMTAAIQRLLAPDNAKLLDCRGLKRLAP